MFLPARMTHLLALFSRTVAGGFVAPDRTFEPPFGGGSGGFFAGQPTAARINPDVTYQMYSSRAQLNSDPERTTLTDGQLLDRLHQT